MAHIRECVSAHDQLLIVSTLGWQRCWARLDEFPSDFPSLPDPKQLIPSYRMMRLTKLVYFQFQLLNLPLNRLAMRRYGFGFGIIRKLRLTECLDEIVCWSSHRAQRCRVRPPLAKSGISGFFLPRPFLNQFLTGFGQRRKVAQLLGMGHGGLKTHWNVRNGKSIHRQAGLLNFSDLCPLRPFCGHKCLLQGCMGSSQSLNCRSNRQLGHLMQDRSFAYRIPSQLCRKASNDAPLGIDLRLAPRHVAAIRTILETPLVEFGDLDSTAQKATININPRQC